MSFNFVDHKVQSGSKLQIDVIDTETIKKQEFKQLTHIN